MRFIIEVTSDLRLLRVPLTALLWALVGWGGYLAFSHYPLLGSDVFWLAARGLAVFAAVFVWWWFRSERRSACAVGVLLFDHALIGYFVVAAPMVALLTSGALVLNGYLDTSAPVRQQAVVESRSLVSGFRGSPSWVVAVRDGRLPPGELLRFAAGNGQPWLSEAQPGDRLWITTHAGAFGWMWFTQVTPVQEVAK